MALILGVVIFFAISDSSKSDFPKEKKEIRNVASKPPYVQPDYSPDLTPKNEPQTKNKKYLPEWQTIVKEGAITSYTIKNFGNPGGAGESFEEGDRWEQELQRVVEYLQRVKVQGVLYDPSVLNKVNLELLFRLLELCYNHKIDAHVKLREALGNDCTMYIVFYYARGVISASFILIPPNVNPKKFMWKMGESINVDFVGFLKVKSWEKGFVIKEWGFAEEMPNEQVRRAFLPIKNFLKKIDFEDGIPSIGQPGINEPWFSQN